MALTFRDNKGSELSFPEMDSNFRHFTGSFTNTGTITAAAFAGDGSAITGVTAEWDGTHNGNANITGSLTVTSDVSSSGNVYGSRLNAAAYVDTPQIQNTTSNTILISDNLNVNGVNGNITASSNISASGTVTGNTGSFQRILGITNAQIAEVTIDNGIVTGATLSTDCIWNGNVIASAYLDTDTAHLSGTQTFTGNKTFTNITASGNISASGEFIGASAYITNITASGDIIQGFGESSPTIFRGAENISIAIGNNCYPNPTAGARYNVALGRNALSNATTAQQSCAIGDSSLQNVTNGNYNNALGFGCLNGIETGSYNIGIGHQALFYNHNITGNTAIGYRAMFGNNNNDDCTYNTILGYQAGLNVGSGSNNVMIGKSCVDDSNWKSSNNVYVGAGCVPSAVSGISNENVFGYATTGIGTNSVAIGNTSVTAIKGQVATSTYSDSRIKRNIQSSSLGLDFINKLNPVVFQKVNPSEYPEEIIERRYTERTQWDPETSSSIIIPADPSPPTDNSWYDGLISQEVSSSLSELGVESDIWNKDPNGKQGIKYGILTIPLIKAVQELSAKVTALEAQISGSS